MDDVRVQLHAHELVDVHRAGRAHTPEVVAPQVDEHHVLGALLLVGAQVGDEAPVLGGVGAALARTGDGTRLDAVAVHGDQRFGARAAEGEVVEGDVVQIRARVHGSEPAVDRERRHVDRRAEALAEHDLEGVAGVDVVADASDAALVLLAGHRGSDGPRAFGGGLAAARSPAAPGSTSSASARP